MVSTTYQGTYPLIYSFGSGASLGIPVKVNIGSGGKQNGVPERR